MAEPATQQPIRNRDMLALKAYVEAGDATRYDNLAQDLVLLDLTHSNLKQRHAEIRFSKHDTIGHLKNRIHLKTGTAPHFQDLHFFDGSTEIAHLAPSGEHGGNDDDDKKDSLPLGYFGLEHGMRVHCIDINPYSESANGGYEDTSLIQKYVMSDEQYNARKGTLRDWSRQQQVQDPNFSLRRHAAQQRARSDAIRLHKAGLPLPPGWYVDSRGELEYDSDYEKDMVEHEQRKQAQKQAKCGNKEESSCCDEKEGEDTKPDEFGPDSVQGMEPGMRCQVQPGGRRGKVGYVGPIPELPGNNNNDKNSSYWVGIVLDEPVGQNDGSVKGVVYMPETPGSRYGVFVRPTKVQVGDFPERDLLMESEDEEEEDSEEEL